ncbi:MAG: glycine cleavage system protein GcvH [Parachlamydiales bacterium]|nr:glycine cleavage system protein GcvH [Parachlamydiales bacterium]
MRYTESHEWIECKGKIGTVGITSYAQKELGDIVSIELPKVGQMLKAKHEACVLESTKAAADVYAPVSGKVVAVNEALKKDPSLINRHPESTGWLFQIELSNPKEADSLMTEKEYHSLIS